MTDLYAVVGNPISHSRSPRIHNGFAAQTGQDMEYTAICLPLDQFEAGVTAFFARGGCGLNVTLPFKEAAFALADQLTARAAAAGAVNTLWRDAHGKLQGDNTDGAGLVNDLTQQGISLAGKRLLIVGAGGAVRGVLAPLLAAHPAQLVIVNRSQDKAQALAEQLASSGPIVARTFDQLKDLPPFDLIINGTSASLQGDLPPLPPSVTGPHTQTYDMMYAAHTTPFNAWAEAQGAQTCVDGLGMLVEQAAEAFHLWRGVRPDSRQMLATLRAEGL